MDTLNSGINSSAWRHEAFTFADENARIFTVTNCPPIIHPMPNTTEADVVANASFGSLSRPRISTRRYPELAFMLHKLPIADPLLSRICLDPKGLQPTRYEGGWALKDDVRNSWMALEKGLLHISEILLTSTHESSAGSSARYAIRSHEHWPPPQDYGYREMHSTDSAAERSIRRALGAFHVLVARCTLAIALWQFPGPIKGSIPHVSNVRYDPVKGFMVPEWVVHLRAHHVPSSWIDALGDSVLTDFSINMRVGTIFDPTDCAWISIAPVLKAANIPVFVLWHSPSAVQECIHSYPFMTIFAPSLADVMHARRNPPAGKPRVVNICRNTTTRLVPDYSVFDDSSPPFGAYQLPGESRIEFLGRRERYVADQRRRESGMQRERRHIRETLAESGAPPNQQSRVYLWVRCQLVFLDIPPRWTETEYRFSIPPAAYRSIWMVHPSSHRRYNAFYDEWDLWFPGGWGVDRDGDVTLSGTPPSTSRSAGRHDLALEDLPQLLNPSPEDHDIRAVDQPVSFILNYWYGIDLASTRSFTGIDYDKWSHDIWHLFGETKERFTGDTDTQKCLAGWVWAVMKQDWSCQVFQYTWDLDSRHPKYLLGPQRSDPHLFVSLDHLSVPARKDDPDPTQRWVMMTFHGDPDNQGWSLMTSAMGALMIIRRIPEATTSSDALEMLLSAGIPARTGLKTAQFSLRSAFTQLHVPQRRWTAPWRQKGDRPRVEDYDVYCQRLLELAASPHMRAAWLKGGIVWRIMVEVTGKHPDAHVTTSQMEELQKGPSSLSAHHEAVAIAGQGDLYYDDALSMDELDIIAGVVRVYTGRGDQTEDTSWWPKHSAWMKAAGNTGIWSPSDEVWFQRRLSAIYQGNEGPLNAGEWKNKLRRQKKAGTIWNGVQARGWEFTYRNFVMHEH